MLTNSMEFLTLWGVAVHGLFLSVLSFGYSFCYFYSIVISTEFTSYILLQKR